jgi:hypothetical protein
MQIPGLTPLYMIDLLFSFTLSIQKTVNKYISLIAKVFLILEIVYNFMRKTKALGNAAC